jgi:hypothetical protein
MPEKIGKAAVRVAFRYLRQRYRREIRIGIGIATVSVGAAVYLAARNVREG